MFIIAKSLKNHEYLYSKNSMILCKNKKQAGILADFLNNHNISAIENWKLKNNEVWFVHEIDKYDSEPMYKIKETRGKISIVIND